MKLKELYNLAVKLGIENDPRGKAGVKKVLDRAKKAYEALSPADKKEFDKEKLNHPYDDTRILNEKVNTGVKTCLVGIDMDTAEIMLADRLNQKGKKIDLVISHHPSGKAYASFYNVMDMQADMLNKLGVPINVAEKFTAERKNEVGRRVMSANHQQAVDAAKLLGINFMCLHTVADNHVQNYLQKIMDTKKPDTLADIINVLKAEPEYQEAQANGAGPVIINGSPRSRAGKIAVEMTGGTEGSRDIYEKLAQAGVGTLICMHLSEEHYKKAQKAKINVVIAGHISSDNVGLNRLFDGIEKKTKLNIIEASGFRRFKRKK